MRLALEALDPEAWKEEGFEEEADSFAGVTPDPDESEPKEEAIELAALAPDEPEPEEEEAIELAALAPDEPKPEEEEAIELAALAPDEPEVVPDESEPIELAALAPDEPEAVPDESEPIELDRPKTLTVHTRTLAELYVQQGVPERAIAVYRELIASDPSNAGAATRLAELEGVISAAETMESVHSSAESAWPTEVEEPATPGLSEGSGADLEGASGEDAPSKADRDTELEALARDLIANREVPPEVDSPFAWTGAEAEDASEAEDGPTVGDYLRDLAAWRPGGQG